MGGPLVHARPHGGRPALGGHDVPGPGRPRGPDRLGPCPRRGQGPGGRGRPVARWPVFSPLGVNELTPDERQNRAVFVLTLLVNFLFV
ncbi:hypothetical protein ABZ957_30030, partial [Streptomyces sp. NPDC046316]